MKKIQKVFVCFLCLCFLNISLGPSRSEAFVVPVAAIAVGASVALIGGASLYFAQDANVSVDLSKGVASTKAYLYHNLGYYYMLSAVADFDSIISEVVGNSSYSDLNSKLSPPPFPALSQLPEDNPEDFSLESGSYFTKPNGTVAKVSSVEHVTIPGFGRTNGWVCEPNYTTACFQNYDCESPIRCYKRVWIHLQNTSSGYSPDEEVLASALESSADEAQAALSELLTSTHGADMNDFPPISSPVHLVDPETGSKPSASAISAAVADEDERRSPVPTVPPQVKETVENSTSQVTYSDDAVSNTRTRTEVQTETLADGSTRVTTRTEVTDLTTGEAISSSAETETESFTPPGLAVPDEKELDFSPLLKAEDVLFAKFPLNLVHHVRDLLADLSAAPEIPDFDVPLGPFTLPVRFSLISPLAVWFRGVVAFMVFVLSIWEAIKVWR